MIHDEELYYGKKKLNLKETSAIKYFRKYPEEATRGVL